LSVDVEVAQLTILEGRGFLSGVPLDLQEKLEKELSYRIAGVEYSKRYRTTKWDGREHLLRYGKFPAGLLPRIQRFLDKHGVPYETTADSPAEKPPLNIAYSGLEERDFQNEAVEAALLNPRGVIRAPTGSGKSAIAAKLIAAKRRHALVVVPTIDLLHQMREFLSDHLWEAGAPIRAGQLGDGVVDPQPITVATIRTAAKALKVAYESYEYGEYDDSDDTKLDPADLREWVERLGTLIIDEVHIVAANVAFGLATNIPALNKYGFSASPWRDDGADLKIEGATGPVIYRVETERLVQEGYLVPPVIRVISTRGWWVPAAWETGNYKKKIKSQFGECYKVEIVENRIRNYRIAQVVRDLEVPTLVLVKQIKHGRALEDLIPDAQFLSGKDPGKDRVEAYNSLRSGELRVIIATTIADLGLDLPILGALVLAGGGKSSTRHLQRIGRVARTYPGKDTALVIDFDDRHVHKWFENHAKARRKIEHAEWGETAIWI
jgi:superfamily II DNA or RNA helicase